MRALLTPMLCMIVVANVLPAIAAGQAAPSTTTDLVLQQIAVGPPVVGQRSVVDATVFNAGTQDVMATVTFSWGQQGQPLSGNLPTVGPVNVPARSHVEFNFTDWIPAASQMGNGVIIAHAEPAGANETRPDDNARSLLVFVERYDLRLTLDGPAVESVTSRHVP